MSWEVMIIIVRKASIPFPIAPMHHINQIFTDSSFYESESERKERKAKCGMIASGTNHPGYPWFAALKQEVINPENGAKLTKIFRGGTIVSKIYIVTAAEIFITEDTELEEAWRQPDAWQAIPVAEIGYKNIKGDENLDKWNNVIKIDIHPLYQKSSE